MANGQDGWIEVKGARPHTLKDITVELPKGKFVVISGVSGSGKSSLAFDTLYAEGQRRYVESLSSYARQFIGQMKKADCDSIEGLSPAISIDQKQGSHNPRSTVATVTEIQDYLRLLWARIGKPHCPTFPMWILWGFPGETFVGPLELWAYGPLGPFGPWDPLALGALALGTLGALWPLGPSGLWGPGP